MVIVIYFFIFLFGLIIGSFLNCLIWRLNTGESILGRSHCPKCKAKIAWYDNIPVLSFLLLRGRCRHCGRRISLQYPAVELATGILFTLSFAFQHPDVTISQYFYAQIFSLHLLRDWFLIAVMIVVFVYDLRWYLILDVITLPAIVILFIINLSLGFSWQNVLFCGIIGGSFFLIQFLASKGRWLGGGDIRLGVLMGVTLADIYHLALALFLAYCLGSIIGIGLILTGKKQWSSRLPLGVFLSTATVIVLFWGQEIINWYLDKIVF